jgi:hypothetical protein
MTGHYEREHFFAFLFQGETPLPAVIANLRRQELVNPTDGPIYFISTTVGDFAGFAHIALDGTETMAAFMDTTLWDAGLRGRFATEGRWHERPQQPRPVPKGPTRKLYSFLAFCRVFVNQRPSQVLGDIAAAFDDRDPPFVGGSTVIGDFDLFVELGSDERQALNPHVARLGDVPGVVRLEVAFAETQATSSA